MHCTVAAAHAALYVQYRSFFERQTSPATRSASVSSHSFVCPQAFREDLHLLAFFCPHNNSTTWNQAPWTEAFDLCEPFQSSLRVSKLMSVSKSEHVFVVAPLGCLGLSADLQVCGGFEEARVTVFLHQVVDFRLGQFKTGLSGVLHVLLSDGFGHVVKIYLHKKTSVIIGTR